MELNLKDKHVLITGGSKGIGYACAAAFLAEGARVSLVSRSLEPKGGVPSEGGPTGPVLFKGALIQRML